jgi:undecaprenyl-diphosphatase
MRRVLRGLDDYLFHLLYGRGGAIGVVAVVLSFIGEGWTMAVLVPFAFVGRTRRFARWLLATLAGTGILVFALKAIIGRGRPFTAYAGLRGVLLDSPTDCSMPSGHAAGSFAFALFATHALLARRPRPPWAIAASVGLVLVAAAIGVSRVVLGFHFPLDVLAGSVLGGTIGGLAGRRFTRSSSAAPAEPAP